MHEKKLQFRERRLSYAAFQDIFCPLDLCPGMLHIAALEGRKITGRLFE